MCNMTHSYVWHDSLNHSFDTTYSHVWHDSSTVTHSGRPCLTRLEVWRDSFICVTRLTHSYVWHDSLKCVTWLSQSDRLWLPVSYPPRCVTWLIYMCDTTHSFIRVTCLIHSHRWRDESDVWCNSLMCVRDDSFVRVTWLVRKGDVTHSCVWHDPSIYVSHGWFIYVTRRIHVCDTH